MNEYRNLVEEYLSHCLADLTMPENLRLAMNYSLLAGGKRLRPVLCLMCAEICAAANGIQPDGNQSNGNPASRNQPYGKALLERALPFAAGLEMIHTYSLIHDDLPAMDDDDLRRGRPSCHKAFDEATAILAGDALNTDAFGFMARVGLGKDALPAEQVLAALAEVSLAAGAQGMVGGQVLDIAFTGQLLPDDPAERAALSLPLRNMQALKTGALFRAACVSGGLLGGADPSQVLALRNYATHLGVAFQIVDDILDVTQDTATLGKPAGSDEEEGKLTWPALFGLPRSTELAQEAVNAAAAALVHLPGSQPLVALAEKLLSRVN